MIARPGKGIAMLQSDLRSSVIRILKTTTGPVGRSLMRRGRSLLENARPFFRRHRVAAAGLCGAVPQGRQGGWAPDTLRSVLPNSLHCPPRTFCSGLHPLQGLQYHERLRLAGVETDHLDDRRIPERLEELLLFDLVVLVRRLMSPEITRLLEFADEFSIPVICDLDDYIFDEEVIPCSDYLQEMPLEQARELIRGFRELVLRAGYYTGATDFLRERAAALGKASYRIPNGFNQVQFDHSCSAVEEVRHRRDGTEVRIGYFSGTLTHQSDFRMIAPVLVRLLGEFPALMLTVAGDFDLGQFPEFTEFADRVEKRPFVDWRRLPSEIARVDINLIPLVINPFTEGKSDLKYYESALVEVPSVASPTVVYQSCIEPGSNGFLARTSDDWYAALRALIVDSELRRRMGKRAYQHAIENYAPPVIASHALTVYRSILQDQRRRLGVEGNEPTVTILLADLERAIRDRMPALTLCNALSEAGFPVTLQIPSDARGFSAKEARSAISGQLGYEPRYGVQVGSDIACCDLLLATDFTTAFKAHSFRHRTRWAAYLVSEYEPAHLTSPESRDLATRSYRLDLDLLALDPWSRAVCLKLATWPSSSFPPGLRLCRSRLIDATSPSLCS